MASKQEYLEFADECARWAALTRSEEHRTGEGESEAEAEEGEGITLPQLMELVERAAKGDSQLGAQLFPAMQQMSVHPDQPPELRALAGVLVRILAGERAPNLDDLPPELASVVRGMLGRLKNEG